VLVRSLARPGAALAAAGLLAGCGAGEDGSPRTASSTAAAGNESVLSAADSARLVAWFRRFRACLGRQGMHTEAIVVTRRELSFGTPTHFAPAELVDRSVPCGEALGNPPSGSSLQVRPGEDRIVLYLPKRCLLDRKVARSET
jgi:hypothetical protein